MNKSFKVVFSKARSALMVVNEATSSVQAKGTKTVVATAVAAMIAGVAGTAAAATEQPTAWVGDEATVKKVKYKNDLMILEASNPKYEARYFTAQEAETIPVRIIGIVRFVRTDFI